MFDIEFCERFSIPDSALAQKATRLVKEVSPNFLYNHCLRTFVFAQMIGARQGMNYDRELLYFGTIMHDLGLTERFDGEQRYEVNGADAARSFLLQNQVSEHKAELVWDAIALHTSIGIPTCKQPEIALVHIGAGVDVAGIGLEDLPPEIIEQAIEAFPRLNCGKALLDLILGQIKRKPESITFTWMSEIGRCHVHGFSCPTIADLLLENPLDRIPG
jgi:HD domain